MTHVDIVRPRIPSALLGGLFGGWKRAIVEGKLKNESADVFREVRRRLESGPPPSD